MGGEPRRGAGAAGGAPDGRLAAWHREQPSVLPRPEGRKVAGKVFLNVTDDPGERIITVKAEPEHGRRLRAVYATIGAGRYLDKTHWISVGAGPGITAALVEELVTDSSTLYGTRQPVFSDYPWQTFTVCPSGNPRCS
ncbi:MmcQ/YjbR family DNA-binding protein [Streptomyces niveiscabiei]|uniref:MmcQ/YjbR family DNA-binding protein n=1 Tax=Streptomyces TaxID=1883 RepID=UPI001F0A6E2D|nr:MULTISPECIES: MmcQ/YjbR family DNA-binding protein [Streptomyces]